jgi:NADH-quinone oxidoreductase subunit J
MALSLRKLLIIAAPLAVVMFVATAPAQAADVELSLSDQGIQKSADGGMLEALMFYACAAVVLGSGLAICLSKNIVRMAVYLFGTLASVALMYFLLLANFIGVIQLIVYAGGTLILLIFGVMLTSKSPWAKFDVGRNELIAAGVVCTLFAGLLLFVVVNAEWPLETDAVVVGSSMTQFGSGLLTDYLVPFEAMSVLLLVVMIGAAYMARQE